MHRRRKYDLAVERGALAFLIANPMPGGGLLSGSSGRPRGGAGIPPPTSTTPPEWPWPAPRPPVRLAPICASKARKTKARWPTLPSWTFPAARIAVSSSARTWMATTWAPAPWTMPPASRWRWPPPGPWRRRISAHTHGLRVCLFTAEEWALAGSRRYLADMDPVQRKSLKLNINLDTVGGDTHLTALISDFPALAEFVAHAGADAGVPVSTYLPFMSNSDHANFAAHGIPALPVGGGLRSPRIGGQQHPVAGDTQAVVQEERAAHRPAGNLRNGLARSYRRARRARCPGAPLSGCIGPIFPVNEADK